MKKKYFFTVLTLITVLLVSCSNDNSVSVKYKGDKYSGNGNTETLISVIIKNENEMLYTGKVKVIDDNPNFKMALEAITTNKNNNIEIDFDENEMIKKINSVENNDKKQWIISIDNIPIDKNLDEISIIDIELGITITYENIENSYSN